jgi:hypothetical protein
MDARPKTVRDILHTGDQYIIPLFQRNYSWKKEHWDRLRKDIWALMEDGAKQMHFLGPLVCTQTAHFPGSVPAYQLIDGQQRLTTLTVLLAAVRDVALARGLKELPEEVSEDYLLHKRKTGTERYKVLPRLGDREVLTAIIEGQDPAQFSGSGIVDALRYFRRHVGHLARQNSEQQLRKLLDAVAARLSLVVVTIDSENPYAIFESLNATGLPLEESDLIRNFIFMQVPLAKQQDFQDHHWKPLEAMFEETDDSKSVPMTPFYRDYLMRNGRYSREDATFVDFKTHQSDSKLTPEQQVKELLHYAELDLMLRRPRAVKHPRLSQLLCQVADMDIATAYPLILHLLDRNRRGTLSADGLEGCLQDLVSFVLRRSICGETTRQYNKWFVEVISAIKENPRQDLSQYWLRRRWPDDMTLKERLADFPIYWREGKKTRVILESIEQSFGHKEKVDLRNLSIEHVMPQTISNNTAGRSWKTMLGDTWEELHDKHLHTIGNLTLTGYNPDLSNSSFDRKRQLLEESHLELNKVFGALPAWTAEDIKRRSAALADVVMRLWPRPLTESVYVASTEAQREPEGLSNNERKYLEYWRQMDARLEERGVPQDLIVPSVSNCIRIPVGKKRAMFLQLGLWRQKNLYVSLLPAGALGQAIYQRLAAKPSDIEAQTGYALKWKDEDFEVYVSEDDVDWSDKDDWPIQHDWLGDHLEDFMRVFPYLVDKLETELEVDPKLLQKEEARHLLCEYWACCATEFTGSRLSFRKGEIERGQHYCRFDDMEDGIGFGLSFDMKHSLVGVYFRIWKDAGRGLKTAFKSTVEEGRIEMRTAIGPEFEWEDPYLTAYTAAQIGEKDGWPTQHKWLRDRAEKMYAELSKRLNLG